MEKSPSVRATQEANVEYVPTKEKILEQLMQCCEGATTEVVQELSDEQGIYRLEVWGPSDGGTRTLYGYLRQGTFGTHDSATTRIYSLEFEGDEVVFGSDVAEYNQKTKVWEVK